MKLCLPPPSIPFSLNPNVQPPRPLGSLQKKRQATYWVRSRRAGSLGGPWGGQRGREKKAKTRFCVYFFFTSFTGRGICRRGFPLGPLSGDHACPGALSPSLVGPLSFMPSRGLQPSLQPRGKAVRWWEGGCVPRWRGPGLSISKGDGHLGNPSRTGETGDEGLTDPTSTQSLGGRWIRKARVPSSPALGRHPA